MIRKNFISIFHLVSLMMFFLSCDSAIKIITKSKVDISLLISGGDNFTRTNSVNLELIGSQATEMYITNTAGCNSGGIWETFSASKIGWVLNQTNSLATVYYKYRDKNNVESSCVSDSIIHDDMGPSLPTSVDDGTYLNSLTTSPSVSWVESSDENGVDHYEVAIGSTPGDSDILNWTRARSGDSFSSLNLTSELSYYASVRAVDKISNISSVAQGDGWMADVTPPGPPTGITLGSVPGNLTTTPSISWTAPSDVSGISSYEAQVHKLSDDSVVQPWTSITLNGSLSGLSLNYSTSYYLKLRAIDSAGNIGIVEGVSDSWTSISTQCVEGSQIFNHTGGLQNLVVPANCFNITVKAWGAGGGGAGVAVGGGGGFAQATLSVTPGESLSVRVGGGGGGYFDYGGIRGSGAGGGYSGVFRSATPLIIAGGGGGAGGSWAGLGGGGNFGGAGGGLIGSSGGSLTCNGGTGGSQVIGGSISGGGICTTASAGGYLFGGRGSDFCSGEDCSTSDFQNSLTGYLGSYSQTGFFTSTLGGGGGSGYYGGAGGAGNNSSQNGSGGGGGGSSFTSGQSTSTIGGSGQNVANSADPSYISSIGQGGDPQTAGGNGLIVINWSGDTTPPGAPTSVILGSSHTLNQSPTISWTAPNDTSGIGSYQVALYKTSNDNLIQTWTTLTSGSRLTGLSLLASNQYYVKVRAIDNAGNIGTSYGVSGNWTAMPCSSGTQVFTYTGAIQTFSVPNYCSSINVKAWGGGGGGGMVSLGGGGGFIQSTISVNVEETLNVIVAGGGGGFNTNQGGGGGGGSSSVQRSFDPLIIAGGGGGGGGSWMGLGGGDGGPGGGSAGIDGSTSTCNGGSGGTISSIGLGGSSGGLCLAGVNAYFARGGDGSATYCEDCQDYYGGNGGYGYLPGFNGFPLAAGNGGYGVLTSVSGGGGGGGYFGGGGGAGNNSSQIGAGGGGGGSSYTTGQSSVSIAGSGQSAANNTDPAYNSNAGQGGDPGTNGNPGRIVISW
jgi:hypothetical protein